MVGYAPNRVIAAIPYAPGNVEPLGINTVKLPEEALAIPQLIIANGGDNVFSRRSGWSAFFKTELTGAKDEWGRPIWNMVDVEIQPLGRVNSERSMTAGWLPTRGVLNAWLSFVKATHSVISQP
jgi:hypothetical protein